ncbi:hypothetical protein pb186bvf_006843 [Paramecium bursaria]
MTLITNQKLKEQVFSSFLFKQSFMNLFSGENKHIHAIFNIFNGHKFTIMNFNKQIIQNKLNLQIKRKRIEIKPLEAFFKVQQQSDNEFEKIQKLEKHNDHINL